MFYLSLCSKAQCLETMSRSPLATGAAVFSETGELLDTFEVAFEGTYWGKDPVYQWWQQEEQKKITKTFKISSKQDAFRARTRWLQKINARYTNIVVLSTNPAFDVAHIDDQIRHVIGPYPPDALLGGNNRTMIDITSWQMGATSFSRRLKPSEYIQTMTDKWAKASSWPSRVTKPFILQKHDPLFDAVVSGSAWLAMKTKGVQ
jgi:hypothetical protein